MEGQFGRFQKKSSFLFPFALASHLFTGMKREQKSGNGRKTPKWQKERAGKPKFSCTAGEQILKKPRKTPTTVARSPFTPRALSRPESFHVRRRQRTAPVSLLIILSWHRGRRSRCCRWALPGRRNRRRNCPNRRRRGRRSRPNRCRRRPHHLRHRHHLLLRGVRWDAPQCGCCSSRRH